MTTDLGAAVRPAKPGNVADFYFYLPSAKYIFAPTGDLWPAKSVNLYLPPVIEKVGAEERVVPAANWIARNQRVEQMSWDPGRPMLIVDRLANEGGWIQKEGVRAFNLYQPPVLSAGDPAKASRWLHHVRYVYRDDAQHMILWFAHRQQRPHVKMNHAIVMGGAHGIGKDTILEPVRYAVGSWNFEDVTPRQIMGRFNGYLKCVILRVNEARDLGDVDRFGFYDHMKTYTAAPPDMLRIDEKIPRNTTSLTCAASSSRRTTRPTASICRPTTAAITWPGRA
jgi:hypothetical protein